MTEIDPRLSRLYREAATETPPAAVDAAILAAARQPRPGTARRPATRWSRWLVPASLTATLVIGVSVGLLVEREHPDALHGDAAVPLAAAPARAPELAAEPAQPAAAPAKRTVAGKAVAARARAAGAAVRQDAAPMAEAVPEPPPAEAPPPPVERFAAEPAGAADGAVAARKKSLAAEAPAGAPARPSLAPAAAATAPADAAEGPEAWLDAIRRLKLAGRDREAGDELAAFRRAYPDYALPADLGR
ncbi:hypothetical protein EZJ19_02750 [Parasulfuritortus cantonensis]|uniref:Uncharacterized protein n=1 Tax=Parasulfuritortus cantonensis TaxID=2528202 RepID=A0A4V2NWP8_9PROT|nr:hypothetical protein [Parasulfuritortus cantonensis]TCJ18172.1 hypothetical protein EZJ19_02750 [Parasulfuritortus cantonensis]